MGKGRELEEKKKFFFGWRGRKNSILMAGYEFVLEVHIKHLPGSLCQASEERESLLRGGKLPKTWL